MGVSETTRWLPTMPTVIEAWSACSDLQHRQEPFDVPADQWMVGGIELRCTNPRREPAQQLIVLGDSVLDVRHCESLITHH